MLFQPEDGDRLERFGELPVDRSLTNGKDKRRTEGGGSRLRQFRFSLCCVVLLAVFCVYWSFTLVLSGSSIEASDRPVHSKPRNGFPAKGDGADSNVLTRADSNVLTSQLEQLRKENNVLRKALDSRSSDPNRPNTFPLAAWNKVRIYCMVPTIYQPYRKEKMSAVADTWGRRCDVLKFFIDPPPKGETYPPYFVSTSGTQVEMVQVPLVRENDPMVADKKYAKKSCTHMGRKISCRHIWEKVWRSWVYIAEHDLETADFFFKIDDDSFIFVEFLKTFIYEKGWNPEDDYYFGHVSMLSPKPFVNGAMVGLSRSTLRKAAVKYLAMPREYGPRENFVHHRCVDRDGASQEVTESICLYELGIHPTTLTDSRGLQMVSLFRLSDSLSLRKRDGSKSWYWYMKPKTQVCCSDRPVAIHWYKFPKDLHTIERLLYDFDDHTLEDAFLSRTEMDLLMQDPKAKRAAVISSVSDISRYQYFTEIDYLLRVKDGLGSLLGKSRI